MRSEPSAFLGVDVGATKTIAALFGSRRGKGGAATVLAEGKIRTPGSGKAKDIVAAIVELAGSLREEAGLTGPAGAGSAAGVAVPGPLDRERGIVRYTPNLGMENYPLAAELQEALGIPVVLENDVQAGVRGELEAGALRGARNAVGLFIGTGIGGGIVIDGKLYTGSTGSAGEIGHMILLEGGPLCGCGNFGCLEALASRSAMAKDAVAAAASGKSAALREAAGTDFRKFRSSAFEEALEEGDAQAGKIVDRAGFWLGVGMANIVNLLNPELILLGGGVVARFGKRLREAAKVSMEERLMPGLGATVRIVLSELGDLAVPCGCALAAEAADGAGDGGKEATR